MVWGKRPRIPIEERFWGKVDTSGDCWLWNGAITGHGYGTFWNGLKNVPAHRFALEISIGRRLSTSEWACHRCDNPPCVRAEHLFIGSSNDNVQDMIAKGRQRHPAMGGERASKRKLTQVQVDAIRRIHSQGNISHGEIARQFGVDRSNIGMIIRRRTWA